MTKTAYDWSVTSKLGFILFCNSAIIPLIASVILCKN